MNRFFKSCIILFIVFFSVEASAQKAASASIITAKDSIITDTLKYSYKSLESKVFYNVGLSAFTGDGQAVYKVNDKVVSKRTYTKYQSKWVNIEQCKPCILYSYDQNDHLLSKGVHYTDCIVGYYIEYYPNGKVKSIEHYKENPNNDWSNAYERGYCNKKEGCCTYYNQDGTIAKIEIYKDGVLVN